MEGFNKHRWDDNPKEKEIHDKFKKEFVGVREPRDLCDFIVFGEQLAPNDYLTDREKQIVLSAMQWLGSPAGQDFLRECGFVSIKELVPDVTFKPTFIKENNNDIRTV
jgi:hypothetical protein